VECQLSESEYDFDSVLQRDRDPGVIRRSVCVSRVSRCSHATHSTLGECASCGIQWLIACWQSGRLGRKSIGSDSSSMGCRTCRVRSAELLCRHSIIRAISKLVSSPLDDQYRAWNNNSPRRSGLSVTDGLAWSLLGQLVGKAKTPGHV